MASVGVMASVGGDDLKGVMASVGVVASIGRDDLSRCVFFSN